MSYLVYMKEALANIFKPPVTSQYPLAPRKPVDGDRGRVMNDISKCILCGMCERSCPADAIHVDRKTGTWTINPFACVQCANCVANCPKKCLSMSPDYFAPDTKKSEIILTVKKMEEGKRETTRKVAAIHPSAMAKALDDRSHVVNNMLKCIFCGMCMRNCPAGAITVDRRTRMWRIDLNACINCGTCIDNCPRKCLSLGCYLGNKSEITLYGPEPRRPARRAAGAAAPARASAGGPPAASSQPPASAAAEPQQEAPAPFQGAVLRTRPANRPDPAAQGAAAAPVPPDPVPAAAQPQAEASISGSPLPLEGGRASEAGGGWRDKATPVSVAPAAQSAAAPEPQSSAPASEAPAADVPQSDNPTHVVNDIDRCLLCGKCEHNCPADAIHVDRRARTWTIDREKCLTCGVCVENCPAHSLTMADDWADGENRALVLTMQGKPPMRRRPAPRPQT